jgi:hypothetical protein
VEPFHNFFAGAQESYTGDNRPLGALLSFYAREGTGKDSLLMEIRDSEGKVIREMEVPAKAGINRLAWDLKTKGAILPGKMDPWDEMMMGGAPVFYGEYAVHLKFQDEHEQTTVEVGKDPKTPISEEELKENIRRKRAFNELADRLTRTYKQVEKATASMNSVKPLLREDSLLLAEVDTLLSLAGDFKAKILPQVKKGILGETPDLRSQLLALAGYYSNPMVKPESNSEFAFQAVMRKVEQTEKEIEGFLTEYEKLKHKVNDSQVNPWK